jgi:transcriptional antiterminator
MNLRKLLSLLIKQEKNLMSLQQIGLEKKETLVSNNYEKLSDVVATEEQSLLLIQLTEEKRLSLMENLFVAYNIDNKRYKLEILIENLKGKVDPKILIQISDSEKRMKSIINDIAKMNHLNMVLIQQSRSIMNETIQAVINSSNRSILDRKG